MAAVDISPLMKITMWMHSSMTPFVQGFILDLTKKVFSPQEKVLQNCQDFSFCIYSFK